MMRSRNVSRACCDAVVNCTDYVEVDVVDTQHGSIVSPMVAPIVSSRVGCIVNTSNTYYCGLVCFLPFSCAWFAVSSRTLVRSSTQNCVVLYKYYATG